MLEAAFAGSKASGIDAARLGCASDCRAVYRLEAPRAAFLTLALFSPRAPVRGALGAAALRAARLTFLRSILSVMVDVFAMMFFSL